jgi:hypothetical protein
MAGNNPVTENAAQSCPVCSTPVRRYAEGQSKYFGCAKCGTWLSIQRDGTLHKTKHRSAPKRDPFLKAGATIKYNEVDYRIIALVQKADYDWPEFTWREYTLFHPMHGYLWISEAEGHWYILHEAEELPQRSGAHVVYKGRHYQLFQKSRSVVQAAEGEFPTDVYHQTGRYEEYIAPPFMLSAEKNKTSHTWHLAEYIEPAEAAKLLGVNKDSLPPRTGISAAQPSPAQFSPDSIIRLALLAGVALLLIQILFASLSSSKVVLDYGTVNTDSTLTKTIASEPFTLDGGTTNLDLEFSSNVDNNWAEAEIALVKEGTNEARAVSLGHEYYHGYDGGESWSEGSTESSTLLCGVGPGRYHLNMTFSRGNANGSGYTARVRATHDVAVWSNFFIILGLLAIFPVFYRWRSNSFEKKRWMNSDYSPFSQEDPDE